LHLLAVFFNKNFGNVCFWYPKDFTTCLTDSLGTFLNPTTKAKQIVGNTYLNIDPE